MCVTCIISSWFSDEIMLKLWAYTPSPLCLDHSFVPQFYSLLLNISTNEFLYISDFCLIIFRSELYHRYPMNYNNGTKNAHLELWIPWHCLTKQPRWPTNLKYGNDPLGALDSLAWLSEAAVPSYLFKVWEQLEGVAPPMPLIIGGRCAQRAGM